VRTWGTARRVAVVSARRQACSLRRCAPWSRLGKSRRPPNRKAKKRARHDQAHPAEKGATVTNNNSKAGMRPPQRRFWHTHVPKCCPAGQVAGQAVVPALILLVF